MLKYIILLVSIVTLTGCTAGTIYEATYPTYETDTTYIPGHPVYLKEYNYIPHYRHGDYQRGFSDHRRYARRGRR